MLSVNFYVIDISHIRSIVSQNVHSHINSYNSVSYPPTSLVKCRVKKYQI